MWDYLVRFYFSDPRMAALLTEILAPVVPTVLIWWGLRAAGLRVGSSLLVALVLMILSTTLLSPGAASILMPLLPEFLAMMGVPLLTPFAVAFFMYRGLKASGLDRKRAGILAAVSGLVLLASSGLRVGLEVYLISHHALG